jgi:hypothetical protein
MTTRKMLMSDRLRQWIEMFCCVPSGLRRGERVILFQEQTKLLRQIYDAPAFDPVKLNGVKGEMALYLGLAHLAGPMIVKQFGDVYFADVDALWAAASPTLQKVLRRDGDRLCVVTDDEGPRAA